jgi:3-isopropylmalate/(R)-2-methylmalate dehydratase small subunit
VSGPLAERLRGRAWKLGDSVDTNQLAGGGLVGATAEETLRINCLLGLRPEFPGEVRQGDLVVAGRNFGCGSSRQSAVEALQLSGVAAVLGESIARIHRRNSIALAFPTFAVPGVTDLVDDGDVIEVDYPAKVVRNVTRGGELAIPVLPSGVEEIYEAGGILQVVQQRLVARGVFASGEPSESAGTIDDASA